MPARSTNLTDDPVAQELLGEMAGWPIFDPHSHIDPHRPAARNLDEVLGYHYYTELAHCGGDAGRARSAPTSIPGRDRATWPSISIGSTTRSSISWLMEIARTFHGFHGRADQPRERSASCTTGPSTSTTARRGTARSGRPTNLEAVFLTNEFDDPLEGWDTAKYVPCLRTDDLVLKLHEPRTIERLRRCTRRRRPGPGRRCARRSACSSSGSSRQGARACAISLPPDFRPRRATPRRAVTPVRRAIQGLDLRPDEHEEIRTCVFWMLAEFCAEFRLPFDLMIGPIRNVYPAGVSGGRDLFDRRVSLYDYRELFNHFAAVTFPVSTLSPDAGAELVAYSWIFPNVLPMGHWWYSNVPAFIAADLTARIQARAQGEAGGLLLRRLQARIHPAQVQHVPPDPGRDAGRGMRAGQGMAGRAGPSAWKSHPSRQSPPDF